MTGRLPVKGAMKKWKKLKSKLVFKDPHFTVREDTVELPTKEIIKWTYWESNDSVLIVGVTKENKFVFVRQHRYLVGGDILEFPAGGINEGENEETAAAREFLEETGYKCSKLVYLGSFYETYGQLNRQIHLFFTKDIVKSSQDLDRGERGFEDIQVELVDFERGVDLALRNKIPDLASSLAILLLREKIDRKEIVL
jgi:ADP-ribose pyrophosphatase